MQQTDPAPPATTSRAITLTLALSTLLASLGTSIANIALPTLVKAFAAPFAQVQAVVVAYLAALTIAVIVAGRLGDRHGLKPMLVAGLALFATASLLCALAPTLDLLIGARVLQGIGAAFLMTLSMVLMRQTAGAAKVGRAMGLLGTVSALGTALGPSLGGLLLPFTGWRGIFWLQFPLAVIAMLLAVATLPGLAHKPSSPAPGLPALLNRPLAAGLLVNVLVASVMMTTLVVGPFYLSLGLGLSATLVGLVMAIGPIVSIASGVPSGHLVDAWGAGRVLAGGLALLAVGALLLAILPDCLGVLGYVIAIIVLTPGYQLFQAANNTAALLDVPVDRRGTVSGLLALSRNTGLIAGASLMGAVFAWAVGTDDFSSASLVALGTGMRLTFLLAGGLMLAAMGVAFGGRLLGRRRPQRAA